ncbi:MAG: cyclase family protein [Acidobacteria bacterium]|nr:cyclase family protein [Acidobacteriota bacterium]
MRINKMISKSAAVFFLLLLLIPYTLDVNGQTNSHSVSTENVVDLTHTLTEDFPYIPIPGITFPFKKTPIATIEKMGVAANRWEIHEHIGTQIDAPSHFIAGGLSLEQMPVRNFIARLAVIDISERARTDMDTEVTIEDIKNWEKKYGRLPKGSAVFMYSGWDAKVNDAKAFINMDGANTMHFPGFSSEAALFLARERDIVGIGVDTLSLDPGTDKEYKAHKAWLAAGKWGVECVANLKQVPPVGATVFVGASKVGGATGGLVRLLATFPSNGTKSLTVPTLRNHLLGTWKSAAAEPVGNLGFRTREFTFTTDRWLIEVVFYSDKEMTKPLFSFVGEGPYTLGENSTVVPGATNATFFFDKKRLTLLMDDAAAVAAFKFDACNLTKGVTKDISASGCSNFTSVAVCGKEYDLVNIERNTLRLGARPADGNMCLMDKRPKDLGQPLIKQNH